MSDSGVIPRPEDRVNCLTCLDYAWIDVDGCTCGTDPHDRLCGLIPCPEGCDDAMPP
jgi:hypothetical protein